MRYVCLFICIMYIKVLINVNVLDIIMLKVRYLFCVKYIYNWDKVVFWREYVIIVDFWILFRRYSLEFRLLEVKVFMIFGFVFMWFENLDEESIIWKM